MSHKITLPNGAVVESEDPEWAFELASRLREPNFPEGELTGEPVTLHDLQRAWERKAGSSNYSHEARSVYCDVAEKLDAVLNECKLTESP